MKVKLPTVTEKQFQSQVVRLAKLLAWRTYHTYDSRKSDKGFPDLVLTDGTRTLFVELKSDTGRVTKEQQDWLDLLRQSGQEVYLWRPRDWADIVKVLGGVT